VNLELETISLINLALQTNPDTLMTTAFNLNGIVLLDLAARAGFSGQVVFVDTGYHFPETLEIRDQLILRYPNIRFTTLSANPEPDHLWQLDTDACCAKNKVAPLKAFLEQQNPSALLNARSREQNNTRANIELREETDARVNFNPLAFWTRAELEAYAKQHQLKLHPLYAQGYLSIGCAPCTRAVNIGEDARAGRWAGTTKTECGLWNRGNL
jgi:phosphoadenosine phosphosulfate reductase